MIRPLNIGETKEVVIEKDSDNPTVFEIQILDSLVHAKLTDLAMVYRYNPSAPKDAVAETRMDIANQNTEFVRFGLKNMRNFLDAKGSEIKIKFVKRSVGNTEYDVVSDEILKVIPNWVVTELANEIAKMNRVSEAERKN